MLEFIAGGVLAIVSCFLGAAIASTANKKKDDNA